MVMKARQKNAVITSKVVKSMGETKNIEKKDEWLSKEQLIAKFGEQRTKVWIENDVLTHRPCQLTGIDSEFLREYWVTTESGNFKASEDYIFLVMS